MSGRKRRVFDPAFKVSVVERLMSGEGIEALSAELGVLTFHLYKWRPTASEAGPRIEIGVKILLDRGSGKIR